MGFNGKLDGVIYLDNATATPLDGKALNEMLPFLRERFASPFAYYPFAQSMVPSMNHYLSQVRQLIGATEEDRLILSPSTSISDNAIFMGIWQEIAREYGKNHFLSSQIEEASKFYCLDLIEEMGGISTLLKVNREGAIEPQALEEGISPRTALLSVSLANPILGTVQPMEELGKICQERGVLLHVDLTAAVGKVEISLQEMRADLATFSCTSAFGPKSCSALWIRHGVRLPTFVQGSEPDSIGTLDPAQLAAFGIACQEAYFKRQERMLEAARLRSLFEDEVQKRIPEAEIHFRQAERLPCTSALSFPYVVSETLLYALAQRELYACIGGGTRQEIGSLLQACGVKPLVAKCGISLTFSHLNTEEEAVQAAKIVQEEFQKYRHVAEGLFQ